MEAKFDLCSFKEKEGIALNYSLVSFIK